MLTLRRIITAVTPNQIVNVYPLIASATYQMTIIYSLA
jgi:hypothetical protein